ncbi:cytochrome P450 [Trametopsis cervina]|nr:cytochrome P450 [Trametopsis cervina]
MSLHLNLTVANASWGATMLASCVLWYVWRLRHRRNEERLPHPPGPPGLPLIGNLLDVPKESTWLTYFAMSEKYDSDIIRLNVMGTNIIVLNSAQAVSDLLEKRSSNYSDRPQAVMLNELVGFKWATSSLGYNARWKDHRRAFHQYMGPESTKQSRLIEEDETAVVLEKLLLGREGFVDHIRHMAGSEILRIAYGIEVQEQDDPFIHIAEQSMQSITATLTAGSYLVDVLPFLKYVPEWVPGAGFKQQAREWRHWMLRSLHEPYNEVKRRVEQGQAADCVGASLIENMVNSAQDAEYTESVVREMLASMYLAAGTDSTVSTLVSFILAMVLHPDIQTKAQAEVDLHCYGRLPTFADYDALQYCHAIVKEALRWNPVVPLAVPHQSSSDDTYKGYYIPKGSIVLGNSWAILHDDAIYRQPHAFNPDRFMKGGKLNPDMRDPVTAAFGYGRRICPGRYMAYDSIWITVASLLAVFNFTKAKDAKGNEITPSGEYNMGFLSYPLPFKCDIQPRSAEHKALVEATRGKM